MNRTAPALVLTLLLAGCGGTNQALLASGGASDFLAMGRITDEYGSGDPLATVPITIEGQPYSFNVWIGRSGNRIMVQTASMAGTAAAGFVRGLTGGLVSGDQGYQPFEEAAAAYLAANRGPNCSLANSKKITHIGWEWDFDCPPPAGPSPKPKR